MSNMIDSYTRSQALRQRVLDLLNAAEGNAMLRAEINAALGINSSRNPAYQSLQTAISYMICHGEIIPLDRGKRARYRAAATHTITAEEINERCEAQRSSALRAMAQRNREAAQQRKTEQTVEPAGMNRWIDGRYTNYTGGSKAPIRNQGGQGALRERVQVGSSAEIV